MRPKGLTLVTVVMGAMATNGMAFWSQGMPSAAWLAYWATPVVSAFVLWQFWLGRNWARWLVLLAAVVLAIPSGVLAVCLRNPLPNFALPGWRATLALEGAFGVFMVLWLSKASVRAYFRSRHATHVAKAG